MGRGPKDYGPAKEIALEALRAGASVRDVAAAVSEAIGEPVSHVTVHRWKQRAGIGADTEIAARVEELRGALASEPPPADAEPEVPPIDEADTLAVTRRMLADTLRRAKLAEQSGNYTAAQRAGRDAAALMTVIARLEKQKGDEGDTIRVSRASIDEVWGRIRARVEALLARPLLCSDCGRKLSVEWGTGGKKKGGGD